MSSTTASRSSAPATCPILVSYVAKGLLPYWGLGSGIKRALGDWLQIDFVDDRKGNLFVVTVHRKELSEWVNGEADSEKSSEKILELLKDNPDFSARELAEEIGITQRAVEKQIARLREEGRLQRVGPARGGHWEVIGRSD